MTGKGSDVEPLFGAVARAYWTAGWQPLPLPPGRKEAPPRGFTGAKGALVGFDILGKWIENPRSAVGNVALHLLHPVIGIDVDHYDRKTGGDTLARAEAELGELPPTLVSSARDPKISGIRFYRLPEGTPRLDGHAGQALEPYGTEVLDAETGKTEVLTFIDLISQAHRYTVVWPSVHPDGMVYRWYGHDYEEIEDVPDRALIAELPPRWVAAFTATVSARADSGVAGQPAPTLQRADESVPSVVEHGEDDGSDPFDDDLAALGIESADSNRRLITSAQYKAKRNEILGGLAKSSRGKINQTLYDAVIELCHYEPAFHDAEWLERNAIKAQRMAWIKSGGQDDGDYTSALSTIASARGWVRGEIKRGHFWLAEETEDDADSKLEAILDPEVARDRQRQEELDLEEKIKESAEWHRVRHLGRLRFEEELEAEAESLAAGLVDDWRAANIRTLDQLRERPEIPWQIERWIPAGSAGMIFADEGVGKTFVLLDMMTRVAIGRPWRGNAVRPGKVLVIAGEGEDDMHERIEAWLAHMDTTDEPLEHDERARLRDNLLVHDGPLQIADVEAMAKLARMISNENIIMVAFDTQSACTEGYDENSNSDMRDMIAKLRKIAVREPYPAMITIGHPGHGAFEKDRPKGAKVQLANNDVLIRLERVKNGKGPDAEESMEISIKHRKIKRGVKQGPEFLKLVPAGDSLAVANIGAEDKRLTVAERIDAAVADLQVEANDWAQVVLAALVVLCDPGTAGPTRADVKLATARLLGQDLTGKSPNSRFVKAVGRLVANGLAVQNGAKYWATPAGFTERGVAPVPAPWGPVEDDDEHLDGTAATEAVRASLAAQNGARGAIPPGVVGPSDEDDEIDEWAMKESIS